MNGVGLSNLMNNPQHTQRNQATKSAGLTAREAEIWNQVLDMGSQSDHRLSQAETEHPLQNNEIVENANSAGESTVAKEETPQTKMFVNAQGERILAIKTGFGFKYLKIGYENPLLSDPHSDTEMSSQNQPIQQMIDQYEQMLSTQ